MDSLHRFSMHLNETLHLGLLHEHLMGSIEGIRDYRKTKVFTARAVPFKIFHGISCILLGSYHAGVPSCLGIFC